LQHGQQLKGDVEAQLSQLGFDLKSNQEESHLCCGSAGTYSVLQPDISYNLRDRKLKHLNAISPQGICSANIGCITHLQSGTELPVRHWIEVVDAAIQASNVTTLKRYRFKPRVLAKYLFLFLTVCLVGRNVK
jgi:glycolate oxidase iron-sulfur subunit